MATQKRQRVDLATGITASYLSSGPEAGTALVLLHAWVESARSFDRLVPLLPPTLRTYALDQRGHGESDKPMYGYTMDEAAADIVVFLDALNIERALLVGASSGGYVAQQVAIAQPERVGGLVLIGSPRSLRGRPAAADELDQLTDPVDRSFVESSLSWFPRYTEVPEWYVQDRIDDGVAVPAEIWRQSLAGLYTAVPPTEVGPITVPTLIIHGGRDALIPLADAQALAATATNASLIVYDEVGHFVLWERPERVASDVAAFLAGLTPSLA